MKIILVLYDMNIYLQGQGGQQQTHLVSYLGGIQGFGHLTPLHLPRSLPLSSPPPYPATEIK